MSEQSVITIQSEEQLFEVLKGIDEDILNIEGAKLHFDGWPTFRLRVVGEGYDATITPALMKGFLELQSAIYRSYAMARYNTPKATKLNQYERDLLTIRIKVEQGSSLFGIDFQEILENLAGELVGKMDAKTIAITVLGFAALYFADSSYKSYLDSRVQTRIQEVQSEEKRAMLEQMKFAQEQETERAKIMASIVSQQPRLQTISHFSNDAKAELIKRSGDATSVEVQGVVIDGESATELMKNARKKSNAILLDGQYRILFVDSSNPESFKVKLRSLDSKDEFVAVVEDTTLDRKFLVALQQGEWSRAPVKLHIDAREANGEIRQAKVTYAEMPK
ncbi:hypothetical protein ACOMICROBIO_LMKGKHOH_02180 [Vibrio sp. B1FIG11]|uniref:Uncharacterized protein n=1 Tax=Vibrio jasicida TaxID=766224 RepID=A0AAU9R1Z2_9VIBR|nr:MULTISPECIES: hypothetical protein [Vibrio]CAH1603195.1 conserved hypothetical protein [Vibrio jasicida]MBE3714077.1 hypothetical protein [Vibrio parahaemolyticus]MBM4923835.1 hypothetical protein [Vibrio parahaemolyticus]MDF4443698.1 hypothetical protein [Vibrio parahaemolyticus]CAD7806767.1 hypothetical protein ACOMICROBIO_LMKGKHOH_02180 [Vibrio sp. B1FIG11]